MSGFHGISVGLDLLEGDALVGAGDLSPGSRAALATATWVAAKDGAQLHLMTALDLDVFAEVWLRKEEEAGRGTVRTHALARLGQFATQCREQGVPVTSFDVAIGHPAEALVRGAAKAGRDLIVVGTRERGGVARNLLGSTALRLVRRAPVPVWVARAPFGASPPVVLCAIDLGDMAPATVGAAARVARQAGGKLSVLHVVDGRGDDIVRLGRAAGDEDLVVAMRHARRERAELEVPAIVEKAAEGVPADVRIVEGVVDTEIVRAVEELRADLLVVGSVVHSALGAAFGLGRTAEHVLSHARASLLVLKP